MTRCIISVLRSRLGHWKRRISWKQSILFYFLHYKVLLLVILNVSNIVNSN